MRTRLKAVKGGDLRENNIKVDQGEIRYADVAIVFFFRKKMGHNSESL